MRCHSNLYKGSKAPFIILSLHLAITLQLILSDYRVFLNALALIYLCLLIATGIAYTLTSYTDPGYVSKKMKRPQKAWVELQKFTSHFRRVSTDNEDDLAPNESEAEVTVIGQSKSQEVSGLMVETRFCTVCLNEQPLRTKHCKECGRCVVLHDHHCPWIGICIGEKNRRVFWWYLLFQCALLWLAFSIGVQATYAKQNPFIFGGTLFSLGVILLFGIMVTLLLGFHTYLACANLTTWETASWNKISYLRDRPHGKNPFSQGLCWNLKFFCCRALPEDYTLWEIPIDV